MRRRDFLKIFGGLVASSVLSSCADAKESMLLKNENRPGFYIRFYKPFKPVDTAKWSLKVGGLCEKPQSFDIVALKELKKVMQVSRLKCVECWSAKAKWGGFRAETLFNIVNPEKEAEFLYFYSADGYYEYISLKDLLNQRVLFAYEMDDKPLSDEHGAPLRLIIPSKYGYKNVKTIVKLEFVAKGGAGYWSNYGYSRDATIQIGEDYPLDIGKTREIKMPGELNY